MKTRRGIPAVAADRSGVEGSPRRVLVFGMNVA